MLRGYCLEMDNNPLLWYNKARKVTKKGLVMDEEKKKIFEKIILEYLIEQIQKEEAENNDGEVQN